MADSENNEEEKFEEIIAFSPFALDQKVQLNFFDAGIITDCYIDRLNLGADGSRFYTVRVETGPIKDKISKFSPTQLESDEDDTGFTYIENIEEFNIEPVGGWEKENERSKGGA